MTRRDIIADYADPSSEVFAPVDREGGFSIDNLPADLRVRSRYLSTYQGLLELEASLPVALTQPRITVPQRAQATKPVRWEGRKERRRKKRTGGEKIGEKWEIEGRERIE